MYTKQTSPRCNSASVVSYTSNTETATASYPTITQLSLLHHLLNRLLWYRFAFSKRRRVFEFYVYCITLYTNNERQLLRYIVKRAITSFRFYHDSIRSLGQHNTLCKITVSTILGYSICLTLFYLLETLSWCYLWRIIIAIVTIVYTVTLLIL